MTTASALAFSTMEVPVLDDTMEMASPYTGHADDFDIDLDVMEDQASSTDKDMTAADDYPATLQEADFDEHGAKDADMLDDIAEPTMIDADDQYQEASHNVEMQYGIEVSYEEEMLEDDYVEDIDAAVPEFQEVQVSGNTDQLNTKEVGPSEIGITEDDGGKLAVETRSEAGEDHHEETGEESQEALDEPSDGANQLSDVNLPERAEEISKNHTNGTDEVDFQLVHDGGNEIISPNAEQVQGEGDRVSPVPQPVEERKEAKEEIVEEQTAQKPSVQEAEQGIDHEPEKPGQAVPHPVKVYYQDNEISLFPPREGDPSETFFLEDEALAYEPLAKLFESCREVLYEHVGENEVLVFNIESLNMQLVEDSSHGSKATLHQIIDVYLRLCHNDGIDTPEPLYLTLSTKLTVSAEISDLLLAANQGKGLSEIHLWDEYQDDIPEEVHEAFDQEESQGPHQDKAEDNDSHIGESQPVAEEVEPSRQGQVASNMLHVQEPEGADAPASEDQDAGVDSESDVPEDDLEEEGEVREANDSEPADQELGISGPPYEASYDSEEQTTETTVTLANLPGVDVLDEEENASDLASASNDDEAAEDHEAEDYPEEEHGAELDAVEELSDNVDHGRDSSPTDSSIEEPRTEHAGYHAPSSADNAVPGEDYGDDLEETSATDNGDALYEDSDSTPNLQLPESREHTPEATDDSLGLVEDLFKSPSKEAKNEDATEFGEVHEGFEDAATVDTSQEDDEGLSLDDEEYIDLGLIDASGTVDDMSAIDSKPPKGGPMKRSREPEDEFELAETPTPDYKRTRSS